jgi:hypothetical protein
VPGPVARPASASAARHNRRIAVVAVAAVLTALLVLAGGTTAALLLVNRDGAGTAADGGNRFSPGPFGTAGGTPGASASKAPAKYDIRQAPENLCEKVDLSALATVFETAGDTPDARRNVSTYLSNASCILSRAHNGRDGLAISIATMAFGAYIFTESAAATQAHQQSFDNAKLNVPTVTGVPGLGEEAFIYREKGNTADPGSDASYVVEARDANLRWTVSLTATHLDGKWTDSERNDLESRLITVAKASFTKFSAT